MIIRSCVTQKNLNWMCGKFRFQNDDISGMLGFEFNILVSFGKIICNKIYLMISCRHKSSFLYTGCMLTCDKDFCNGASILSETGINAFLLTIALCMAATHMVLFLMLGFDPFEIFNI